MSLKYEHLVGRPFTEIGGFDCLQLVTDFYRDNFGIIIPHFARPKDWLADKLDLINLVHEKAGFTKITDWRPDTLQPADLLCLAINEATANHLVIYLGDDKILHHLYGRFSKDEVFRDIWRTRTAYVLRHPSVPDLRPVYPDVQLEDMIRDRNAAPTG